MPVRFAEQRSVLEQAFQHALQAAQPAVCLPGALSSLPRRPALVLGAGKAAASMAAAFRAHWDAPARGLVVKIDGEMRLEQGFVRFRGEDPGFLWRKKATEYIQGKLKSYLDPKTTLGDLPRGK